MARVDFDNTKVMGCALTARREVRPQRFGQVGHRFERHRSTRENLAADLPDAHGRLAAFGEPRAERVGRHVEDAGQRRGERGAQAP